MFGVFRVLLHQMIEHAGHFRPLEFFIKHKRRIAITFKIQFFVAVWSACGGTCDHVDIVGLESDLRPLPSSPLRFMFSELQVLED